MRRYDIAKTCGEPDWKAIPALSVDNALWLPDFGIRMEQQVCYDETALYVRQRAWEQDVRAEHTSPLSPVCEDSCMEFFFSPGDGRYFNIELNPNGCLYLGFGAGRAERVRLVSGSVQDSLGIRTARLTGGWEARYRIPVSFLRIFYPDYELKEGGAIYANCYKCGDRTANAHYLAWNAVRAASPDFHRPEDFGEMLLCGPRAIK